MADTPPTATETKAPSPPETPVPPPARDPSTPTGEGGGPSLDLSQKVALPDGTKVSVGDLIQERQEAQRLRQYRENASVLMQGSEDPAQQEKAVRYIMSEEGYSPEQIEEYVSMMQDRPEPTTRPIETPTTPQGQGEPEQDAPRGSGGFDEERVRRIEERVNQTDLDNMRLRLDESVGQTLDQHTGLRVLLGKAKEFNDEDGFAQARKVIQGELERQTLENLRARKARGETFRMDWFAEESQKAAEAVLGKFRSVIGDPDKLQRAPETESAEDVFLKQKPVPPPEYKAGMTEGDVRTQLHDWTVDTLSRLAVETDRRGQTRA